MNAFTYQFQPNEFSAFLDAECQRLVKERNIQCKELDEQQIAEALRQAMLAGDFHKYVCVSNGGQTIVYIPGLGIDELRSENERLRKKIQDIQAVLNPPDDE